MIKKNDYKVRDQLRWGYEFIDGQGETQASKPCW